MPLEDAENLSVQPRATGGVDPDEVITDEMRDAVLGGQEQYWQSISYVNENGDTVPGVIFGLRITSLPQGARTAPSSSMTSPRCRRTSTSSSGSS